MTKDELLALIRRKIDGQGSQVDIGGALGDILRGLVDLIPSGGGYTFAAPLKLSGTDVSLEYGSGLEKDDNMLAVKLDPNGGLKATGNGIAFSGLPTITLNDEIASQSDISEAVLLESLGWSSGEFHKVKAGIIKCFEQEGGDVILPIGVVRSTTTDIYITIGDYKAGDDGYLPYITIAGHFADGVWKYNLGVLV